MIIFITLALIALFYWLFMSSYSQVFGEFIYRAKTNKKVVALTFDDGPNSPHTEKLLDTLKKEKVKATFFIVGKCALRYPKIVKRIDDEGHTIGNHSHSHNFFKYFCNPGFKYQIQKNQSIIEGLINKSPRLFRPPWLFRNPIVLKTVKNLNMDAISGKFCHELEVFQISSSRIAKRTISKVTPGSIIIFHDGVESKGGDRAQTVDAVQKVITELKKQNYTFLTVDGLLGVNPYKSDKVNRRL